MIPGRTPRSREDLDADLQRAIELSLAESQPSARRYVGSEPPLARKAGTAEDDDEEMRLANEASLRDMEARPSAPHRADEPELRVRSIDPFTVARADSFSPYLPSTSLPEKQRPSLPSQIPLIKWRHTASETYGGSLTPTCCMSRRTPWAGSSSGMQRRRARSNVSLDIH